MKIDPCCHLSAAKRRTMILVSRNIRYMQIFAGVPQEGVSKDSGVVDYNFFGYLGGYFF